MALALRQPSVLPTQCRLAPRLCKGIVATGHSCLSSAMVATGRWARVGKESSLGISASLSAPRWHLRPPWLGHQPRTSATACNRRVWDHASCHTKTQAMAGQRAQDIQGGSHLQIAVPSAKSPTFWDLALSSARDLSPASWDLAVSSARSPSPTHLDLAVSSARSLSPAHWELCCTLARSPCSEQSISPALIQNSSQKRALRLLLFQNSGYFLLPLPFANVNEKKDQGWALQVGLVGVKCPLPASLVAPA